MSIPTPNESIWVDDGIAGMREIRKEDVPVTPVGQDPTSGVVTAIANKVTSGNTTQERNLALSTALSRLK